MSHGSVAGVLSFGGKIPANSNSVFTSRQSPFSAPAIARSAFCNSRCSVAEGREEVGSGAGRVADGVFGDAERIYSDILVIWLEASAAQVGGGDLQAIEQQAGGFGVHLAADDHAHDLPEGDLDGVGVLEHGQNKLACDVMGGVAEVNSGHAPATMEVAIFAVAQRR